MLGAGWRKRSKEEHAQMLRTTFPAKILSRELLFLICKPTSKILSPTKEDKRKKEQRKFIFRIISRRPTARWLFLE